MSETGRAAKEARSFRIFLRIFATVFMAGGMTALVPTFVLPLREKGLTGEVLWGLMPLVFVLTGVWMFVASFRLQPGARSGARVASRARKDDIFPPEASLGEAPCEMRRASAPIARFVGGVLIALFWNGIVSVFVFQNVNEWRAGEGPFFSSLFLVPFVLVGLALCGFAVHAFLGLFNPRPRLTLDPGCLVLGGRARLSWTVEGSVDRIKQLTVTLEGREEATYRRGTDTTTDREVFLRVPIVARDGHASIRQGAVTFTVPPETIHSFVAPNNKIVWVLRLQGEIRWWPDVAEEFPVAVLPQRKVDAGSGP